MTLPAHLQTYPQEPLPPLELLKLFAHAPTPQQESHITQIRHLISRYALIIDTKVFDQLSHIFHPDAIANYSPPLGVLNGLDSVKATLEKALAGQLTQHLTGTQLISINPDAESAWCLTYSTSHNWIDGDQKMYVDAFGQYQDFLIKDASTGEWKIKYRHLRYMGPFQGPLIEASKSS